MPSAVAAVVQVVWFFAVLRPLWTWLDKRQSRKYRKDWEAHRRWRDRWQRVYLAMSGPLIWAFWAYDEFDQHRTQRHNDRIRKSREAQGMVE